MSCVSQYIVQRGSNVAIPLEIRDGASGPYVDADTTPTITGLSKNGSGSDETDATLNLSVVQAQDDTPSALTGRYIVSFTSAACAKGDSLIIYGEATVNGSTYGWSKAVDIVDDPGQRISVC